MSRFLLGPVALLLVVSAPLRADYDLNRALKDGESWLQFRARHEHVDDDGFDRDANATTLRTRLGYRTGSWYGVDAMAEFDYVGQSDKRFNDTRNGKAEFPTVADPAGANLNQANLRWRANDLTLTAGRQRINLDNQRFIGGVGWRQNEQTYDALRATWQGPASVTADLAWVTDTRRIFGPQPGTPAEHLKSDHQLVNLGWAASDAFKLGAYHYALDFEDAANLSSATSGAHLSGTLALSPISLDYRLEGARQEEHGDNPTDYQAHYQLTSLGASWEGIRLAVARERLGADRDAGVALATPLATAHAFQGWADRFLATPASGVVNQYVSLGGNLMGVNLLAVMHQFDSDIGDNELGSELNLQASRQFGEHYGVTLKYADYDAETLGEDVTKVWLMLTAAF